jgi:hypothetical protein
MAVGYTAGAGAGYLAASTVTMDDEARKRGEHLGVGYGVGDDDHSYGLTLGGEKWHARGRQPFGKKIKNGDIIGCACDIDNELVQYSVNGSPFDTAWKNISFKSGVRPAVTVGRAIKLHFGPSTSFAHKPPTPEHKSVFEALSPGPMSVLLQASHGEIYGRLCSGCQKITTPITGDGYEIKGSPTFDLADRLTGLRSCMWIMIPCRYTTYKNAYWLARLV